MITAEQRQQRTQFIGSSDVAAICGKDPWRSAMDVYLSKTETLDDQTSDAMASGNRLESAVLNWAEERIGCPLVRDVFRIARDGLFAANHDALVIDSRDGVEAKTVNIMHFNSAVADEWGEEGTDEVPDHVVLQCQQQMYVSDLALVHVPALIGGRGWFMYRVERNDRLIKAIRERGETFWCDHVQKRVPPPDSMPSLDVARSIRRTPDRITQLPIGPVQAWLDACAKSKAAEQEAESAKALVLALMGDAEAADTPAGRLTFLEQSKRGVDAKRLKAERPDVYDAYETCTSFRVLRHKKPK